MLYVAILGAVRFDQAHAQTLFKLPNARIADGFDLVPKMTSTLTSNAGSKMLSSNAILADPIIDAVATGTPMTTL
ncbi:MAG: hypothetical protein AB8B71_19935 [Paracoccaceae bacterium]